MTQQIEITEKNKYSTKDITAWTRQQLKARYKDLKLSVSCEYYSMGSTMKIYILESKKYRFIKRPEEVTEHDKLRIMTHRSMTESEAITVIDQTLKRESHQLNHYYIDDDWTLTDKAKEIIKDIIKTAQRYNYDNSDPMTDYFDVNYYFNLGLGKWDRPFIDGVE